MPHMVRLEDRHISDLVRNVSSGKFREYVRMMLEIAVYEKGRTISIGILEDSLKDLPFLDRSVATRIVRDLEELYEEQQEKRS